MRKIDYEKENSLISKVEMLEDFYQEQSTAPDKKSEHKIRTNYEFVYGRKTDSEWEDIYEKMLRDFEKGSILNECEPSNKYVKENLTNKELIAGVIRMAHYIPTEEIIDGIKKVNSVLGKFHTLQDIHNIYKAHDFPNKEIEVAVNQIAQGCRNQEKIVKLDNVLYHE